MMASLAFVERDLGYPETWDAQAAIGVSRSFLSRGTTLDVVAYKFEMKDGRRL
jgi:hypothetical protein